MSTLNDNQLAEIRNKHIGFVFQNFYLLPKMTALDNVALPLLYAGVGQKERRVRAKEALESVGLADRIHFYPNQLSGGQCQRVAIARAMVGSPELLLADEPTGALDTAAGYQIMEIFRGLADRGMTILMITHEPSIAACANKVYHILDGRLQDEAPEIPAAPPLRQPAAAEEPEDLLAGLDRLLRDGPKEDSDSLKSVRKFGFRLSASFWWLPWEAVWRCTSPRGRKRRWVFTTSTSFR